MREFLKKCGCKHIDTTEGHEKWTRSYLLRPIIIQTHIEGEKDIYKLIKKSPYFPPITWQEKALELLCGSDDE